MNVAHHLLMMLEIFLWLLDRPSIFYATCFFLPILFLFLSVFLCKFYPLQCGYCSFTLFVSSSSSYILLVRVLCYSLQLFDCVDDAAGNRGWDGSIHNLILEMKDGNSTENLYKWKKKLLSVAEKGDDPMETNQTTV